MAFFNSAVGVLQTLVIALGAGLGIWGVINLLEGYGSDNPGAKAERMKLKESRNKVGSEMFLSPRYIANIENKGQHPSLQVFLEMVSRYHISVDQILYGEEATGKSTERMQFDILLDELTDAEIKIITATAQALLDARTDSEEEN